MGDVRSISLDDATAATAAANVDAAGSTNNVQPQLRTRVVREAGRETWFVVNESDDDLATIPLAIAAGSSARPSPSSR